jgi:flagellar secretion chaperone FliS
MKDAARAYRESAVRGASPVGLIVILYEEVIHAMRQAQRALLSGNIEERTHSLGHAIAVVGHLQVILNFEKGGQIARDLSAFYDLLQNKILDANVNADHLQMEWVAAECSKIKQVWQEVDRQVSGNQGEAETAEFVPELATSARAAEAGQSRRARTSGQ